MTNPFENLVFEGGGVKGLAFCGALKVLEERGIITDVKGLAGSSAGAITAGLLACGYTSDEILDELKPKDFNEFKDDDFGIFRDVKRLMTEFGFFAGKEFHRWYGELLAKRIGHPDVTFGEIFEKYERELVVTGTCLNRRETHYYTRKRNPHMPVRDAVRISMSIPLFFAAVEWKGDFLVDGGVLNNYPIWVFDGEYPGDPKGRRSANAAAQGRRDHVPGPGASGPRVTRRLPPAPYLPRLDGPEHLCYSWPAATASNAGARRPTPYQLHMPCTQVPPSTLVP